MRRGHKTFAPGGAKNPWRGRRAAVLLAALLCVAAACRQAGREVPTDRLLSKFLGDEAAKPLLLHDERELLAYLEAFPKDRYTLHLTRNGFSFWIEKEGRIDGIKQIIADGGIWEEDNLRLMGEHIRPGTTAIDAGAFIGTHTLAMARQTGPRGRVYAFEPQKKIFRELVYNLIANGIRNAVPLRFALGEANRIVEMDKPVGEAEALVGVGRGGDRTELRTLDSFHFRNVSFLKIDVEDYERPLLEGARETLAANGCPPILIEIMRSADYFTARPEVRAEIEKTLGVLEEDGYVVQPLRHRDYLALPAAGYRPGTAVSFAASGNGDRYKSGWWWPAESWGSWTPGCASSVVLRLEGAPGKDLVLACSLRGWANAGSPATEISVLANGQRLNRWVLMSGEVQVRKVKIPLSLLKTGGERPLLRLEFRLPDAPAPADGTVGAADSIKPRRRFGLVGLVLREE